MSTQHDVAVIGGGVIGLSMALELTRAGVRTLHIHAEARDRESASRAAGAMLGAYGEITGEISTASERSELEFRIASQKAYTYWLPSVQEQSGRPVFHAPGTFIIGNNCGAEDRGNLKSIVAQLEAHGESWERVEPEDVPGLRPASAYAPHGVVFLPNEGSVDSAELLSALESCLEGVRNCRVLDAEVREIRRCPSATTWEILTDDDQRIESPLVVVCAGSRTLALLAPDLREQARLPSLLFGKGVGCTLTDLADVEHAIRTPNRAFSCGVHLVPRSGGRTYLGGTNFLGRNHDTEQGIEPGELHYLFDEAIHQLNASLRRAKLESSRYGFRPIAGDRVPLCGITQLPGLAVATGTYRNGILMAPLIAEVVREELLTNQTLARNPFTPLRRRSGEVPDLTALVASGARDIAALLKEPRGTLPYERDAELAAFLYGVLDLVFGDPQDGARQVRELRESLVETPMPELFNRLFYEMAKDPRIPGRARKDPGNP